MAFVARYRRMMHLFSTMPVIEVVRYQVHRLGEVGRLGDPAGGEEKHAGAESSRPDGDEPRQQVRADLSHESAVLERRDGEVAEKVVASLVPYEESLLPERRRFLAQYRVIDVAFKVVGPARWGCATTAFTWKAMGRKDRCSSRSRKRRTRRTLPTSGAMR